MHSPRRESIRRSAVLAPKNISVKIPQNRLFQPPLPLLLPAFSDYSAHYVFRCWPRESRRRRSLFRPLPRGKLSPGSLHVPPLIPISDGPCSLGVLLRFLQLRRVDSFRHSRTEFPRLRRSVRVRAGRSADFSTPHFPNIPWNHWLDPLASAFLTTSPYRIFDRGRDGHSGRRDIRAK